MNAKDSIDRPSLVEAVDRLEGAITKLATRSDVQEESLRRNRNVLRVAIVGLALDLLLTIFGGYLFNEIRGNTTDIETVQTRTSVQVLCPLYQVFLNSIKANPHPPGLTPEQQKDRDDATITIQEGYDILQCTTIPH